MSINPNHRDLIVRLPNEVRDLYIQMNEAVQTAITLRKEGVLSHSQYQIWDELVRDLSELASLGGI